MVQAPVATVGAVVRSRSFLLLCAALTVLAFGFYVASLGAIPVLTERGLSHDLDGTTLGLLGAGQLVGRLAYAPLERRTSSSTQLLIVIAATVGVIAALAVVPVSPVVLIPVEAGRSLIGARWRIALSPVTPVLGPPDPALLIPDLEGSARIGR